MIIHKVIKTIKRENLIRKNDRVLIGFSGGPDSLFLTKILLELKEEFNLKIFAAHLNHRIRGLDAQKDALFCYDFCLENNIDFFLKSVDVTKLAKENNETVEERARLERYKMFFDIKKELNIDKIAVGHNLDDNAETIVMKLIRGTGLKGLIGIDYKRDDGIIRPILDVKRQEIETYLQENNLAPRIDKTNLENDYFRNKIRNTVIPYIEREFNPNIKNVLKRTANILKDDFEYIEKSSKESFENILISKNESEVVINKDKYNDLHNSIKKNVARIILFYLAKEKKNIENVHIESVLDLGKNKNLKMINLPYNIKVYIKGNNIVFTKNEFKVENIEYGYKLKINGTTNIEEINLKVETKILTKEESMILPTAENVKVFDYNKVKGDLILRTRNQGDKIRPIGLNGSKKIKDILIDMKVSKDERYRYPVLADDNGIMWLYSYRISENYKIDSKTKDVIRIKLDKILEDR